MLCQIGTVVDVTPSMRINLLAGVALAAATTLTPAQALTIPATGSTSASIFSRDATSQFERNGYAVDVNRTDDGDLGTHASAQASQSVDPLTPSSRTLAAVLQSSSLVSDPNGLSNGAAGGIGSQGSTTVGTVPLPSSLPLFGAALLIVAALGRSRRKRAA